MRTELENNNMAKQTLYTLPTPSPYQPTPPQAPGCRGCIPAREHVDRTWSTRIETAAEPQMSEYEREERQHGREIKIGEENERDSSGSFHSPGYFQHRITHRQSSLLCKLSSSLLLILE
jgi:hypothetical protein